MPAKAESGLGLKLGARTSIQHSHVGCREGCKCLSCHSSFPSSAFAQSWNWKLELGVTLRHSNDGVLTTKLNQSHWFLNVVIFTLFCSCLLKLNKRILQKANGNRDNFILMHRNQNLCMEKPMLCHSRLSCSCRALVPDPVSLLLI